MAKLVHDDYLKFKKEISAHHFTSLWTKRNTNKLIETLNVTVLRESGGTLSRDNKLKTNV